MKELHIADFYYGAFYSYLFTRNINPALIDNSKYARHLSFETDQGSYNVFAMYASKPANEKQDKTKTRWSFTFTPNIYELLKGSMVKEKENYVVLVCGKEQLQDTEVIVVPYNKAIQCLGEDSVNETRCINVVVSKYKNEAEYYGTAVDSKDAFTIKRDISKYLK